MNLLEPSARHREPQVGTTHPPVLIIGAGAAGICLAIHFKKAGIAFRILEKSERVGGTWRENIYPGCACDTHIHQYSYSFETNPNWSRMFAEQPEILAYLERCAKKYGLQEHIVFDTEVAEAHFDDQAGTWFVITTEGEEFTARILISAVGQLNRPATPDIKGLEDFVGTQFHSAKWDYEHDLTGKRVAVIGNGASALQFIPRIAPHVDKLIVFQRSPNWVVPKNDREYGQLEKWAFRHLPGAARFHRYMIYWSWEKFWPKFQKDSPAAKNWRDQVDHIMRTQIEDRDLVTRLIPDYPVGCKRVLLSDDFLEALQRPNVEVVSAPISRIEAGAVVTNDGGAHPADSLILATGFRTNEFLAPMKICGRDSRRLDDDWRTGAEAYYGMTVSGYPNFFMLYGPNTNLGHNSIIFMIECQTAYIRHCIDRVLSDDLLYMDLKRSAQDRFNTTLQSELDKTAWAGGCSSWYKTPEGKVVNNWSTNTYRYWWRTRRPDFSDYAMVGRETVGTVQEMPREISER
ncbi:MAG: NAD(P)/FAD-dependent oxidoreductase [Hyphomicrobiaceae bacterium]